MQKQRYMHRMKNYKKNFDFYRNISIYCKGYTSNNRKEKVIEAIK